MTNVFLAAGIGSALEFYDFILYGLAAAVAFNKVFFPSLDPVFANILSLATFGAGFVLRPVGGMVFGHFGDQFGRRPVLLATLLMVGTGTFLIGCVPSYASIGMWAPILVVLLRMVQGLGAGAEYGSAVVMLLEYAPPHRRGLYASVAPMGVTVGRLMAAGVFALFSSMPTEDFLAWGWRIPFLLSFVLLALGLFVRHRLEETPVFRNVTRRQKRVGRIPLIEALLRSPKTFLIVIGAHIGPNAISFLIPVFGINYLIQQRHVARGQAVLAEVFGEIALLLVIPLCAHLSDRIGRRPVYAAGAILGIPFVFLFFVLVNTGVMAFAWLGFALALGVGYGATFGPQAAFYAELFGPRSRLTGFSTARELATVISAAPGPAIAAVLVAWAHGAPWGVASYVGALLVVTVAALWFAPETYRTDISAEAYEAGTIELAPSPQAAIG